MTIREMHYDFKFKHNKVDTQNHRNLVVPEIDWLLNEASELFVKLIAKPRLRNHLGFEVNQRTLDDIRTIVVNNDNDTNNEIPVTNNIGVLPDDYWHHIRSYAKVSKGSCKDQHARIVLRQHDDKFNESKFDRSNFNWRFVNALIYQNNIKFYTNGDFTVERYCISYIRKMVYMHNAQDFNISATGVGSYNRLDAGNTTLTGRVDCELPEHTHREIVDIAVALATNYSQNGDYNLKLNKLQSFNQTI